MCQSLTKSRGVSQKGTLFSSMKGPSLFKEEITNPWGDFVASRPPGERHPDHTSIKRTHFSLSIVYRRMQIKLGKDRNFMARREGRLGTMDLHGERRGKPTLRPKRQTAQTRIAANQKRGREVLPPHLCDIGGLITKRKQCSKGGRIFCAIKLI